MNDVQMILQSDSTANTNQLMEKIRNLIRTELDLTATTGDLSKTQKEAKTDPSMEGIVSSLKSTQKELQKNYNSILANIVKVIHDGDLSVLNEFSNAMVTLYKEESGWKRNLKKLLVSSKVRSEFKSKRIVSKEMYEIISLVEKTYPVREYAFLSFDVKSGMYGAVVDITGKSCTYLPPLSTKEIIDTIQMLVIAGDNEKAYEWIFGALSYDSSQLVQDSDITKKEREGLKSEIRKLLSEDDGVKQVLYAGLIEKDYLFVLLHAQDENISLHKELFDLRERTAQAEKNATDLKANYESRFKHQADALNDKNIEIQNLQTCVLDYGRISSELSCERESREEQRLINERLALANQILLDKAKQTEEKAIEDLRICTEQLEKTKVDFESVSTDLAIKSGELARLKEVMAQLEESIRSSVLQNLVRGINEQLFYMTGFYLNLKEYGTLDSESVSLFGDVLKNIDDAFSASGATRYGEIEEIIEFDSRLYEAVGIPIANGEKALVTGFGWTINGKVFLKAQVEKVED